MVITSSDELATDESSSESDEESSSSDGSDRLEYSSSSDNDESSDSNSAKEIEREVLCIDEDRVKSCSRKMPLRRESQINP